MGELPELIEDAEHKAETAKIETASSNAELGLDYMKARLDNLKKKRTGAKTETNTGV